MLEILVVIYSLSPEKTKTIRSLKKINSLRKLPICLTIWDNSLVGFDRSKVEDYLSDISNVRYFSSRENTPLSIVYNNVCEVTNSKHVMLLDDDTEISSSFIEEVLEEVSRHPDSVLVPIIKNFSNIISPGYVGEFKGRIMTDYPCYIKKNLPRNTTTITSGLVLPSYLIKKGIVRFNEKLTFYGIDTDFNRKLNSNGVNKRLLTSILNHSSALRDKTESVEKKYWRFDNFMKSWPIVYDCYSPRKKIIMALYMMYFSIKSVILNKNITFIRLMNNLSFILK